MVLVHRLAATSPIPSHLLSTRHCIVPLSRRLQNLVILLSQHVLFPILYQLFVDALLVTQLFQPQPLLFSVLFARLLINLLLQFDLHHLARVLFLHFDHIFFVATPENGPLLFQLQIEATLGYPRTGHNHRKVFLGF